MTKNEFIIKYQTFISTSPYWMGERPKFVKDLNEMIKDELMKFKDFFNSEYESPMPIRDEDIDNYLSQSK